MAAPPAINSLRFTPLTPAPDVGFWQELTRQKLDVLRLDTTPLEVHGYYLAPPERDAPEKCFLQRESFEAPAKLQAGGTLLRGDVKNFNTVEDFKTFLQSGRTDIVAEAAAKLRENITSGAVLENPALLRPFIAITFADLKKYHYAYTVAFPAIAPPGQWVATAPSTGAEEAGFSREFLSALSRELKEDVQLAAAGAFVLGRASADAGWVRKPLSVLRGATESDDLVLAVVDSSSADEALGLPSRNLILAVAHFWPGTHRVLAFRDPYLFARGGTHAVRSRVFFFDASAEAAQALLKDPVPSSSIFAGWSKIQNFDLTIFMDKKRVAADAVDLNVKLMKWRVMPEVEPERMKELRFLLLGSGTLGCSVARTLMGWGVRKMTFLDSGKVSFSNPVRQSLFTHSDAAEGRSKAIAAKEAVEAVMPDAEVEALELEVPMPGHPYKAHGPEVLRQTIQKLKDLVESHDVVCMLTDSRESRWLPSLLVAAAQRKRTAEPGKEVSDASEPPSRSPARPPLGLTVALGFDSFLVQRQTYLGSPAACYFCNDVTAPRDSLAFRTLDQQCTVTRPGLSGISAGIAVELIAALVQHEDRFAATATGKASCLGAVPHQIRGFLAEFKLAPMETEPFPMCICCSQKILERYEEEGDSFIARVIENSAELEEISGLAAMKAAVNSEDCMAFDDFDEEED